MDFLNRKTAKKTLMTIPYSIGKKSAYLSFVELLMKFQPEINATTPQIDKTFKKFYNFVKYDFEKKFLYSISSDEYTNSIMQNFLTSRNIRIETDTGLTDLAYKKMQKKTIDLIFNMRIGNETIKERVTKMIMVPSKSIDYSQTNISLGANLRHFYEADILRITEIHLAYSINSIHDAELIDFNSCSKLILIKNRIFGELLPEFNV